MENASLILFARVTCPNCKAVEKLLEKAGIAYEKKIAEENIDLCKAYGIKGAPTLVAVSGDEFTTYYGVPAIKEFISRQ